MHPVIVGREAYEPKPPQLDLDSGTCWDVASDM